MAVGKDPDFHICQGAFQKSLKLTLSQLTMRLDCRTAGEGIYVERI